MALGIWPDVGALMLAAFVIPTTLLFHPFWTFSDAAQRRTQWGSFFRNVSLLGATLALFAFLTATGPQFAVTGPCSTSVEGVRCLDACPELVYALFRTRA